MDFCFLQFFWKIQIKPRTRKNKEFFEFVRKNLSLIWLKFGFKKRFSPNWTFMHLKVKE